MFKPCAPFVNTPMHTGTCFVGLDNSTPARTYHLTFQSIWASHVGKDTTLPSKTWSHLSKYLLDIFSWLSHSQLKLKIQCKGNPNLVHIFHTP